MNDLRVQRANVHARTVIAGEPTRADQKVYREAAGEFNNIFNGDVDDGLHWQRHRVRPAVRTT
jgi:hypothetical protein